MINFYDVTLLRSFPVYFQFDEIYFLPRLIRTIHGTVTYITRKESIEFIAVQIGIRNHDPLKNIRAAEAYGAANRRTLLSSVFLFDFLVSWRMCGV